MEDIFTNPTFLWIVGLATPVICFILAWAFKKTEPSKNVKQWVSWGLMGAVLLVAILVSGVYKQWTTVMAWITGIVGYIVYYRLVIYEFVIKMLPESWRKNMLAIKK